VQPPYRRVAQLEVSGNEVSLMIFVCPQNPGPTRRDVFVAPLCCCYKHVTLSQLSRSNPPAAFEIGHSTGFQLPQARFVTVARAAFEYRTNLSSLGQHLGGLNQPLGSGRSPQPDNFVATTFDTNQIVIRALAVLLREIQLKSADSSATPPASQIHRARCAVGIKVVIDLRDPGIHSKCSEPRESLRATLVGKLKQESSVNGR
jgi:hypothetical protein